MFESLRKIGEKVKQDISNSETLAGIGAKVGTLGQQVGAQVGQVGQQVGEYFDRPRSMIEATFAASDSIKDGRAARFVYQHACSEMDELDAEIVQKQNGLEPGPDGIVGEAIDVILCMLDLIHLERPEMTEAEIAAYAEIKLAKWIAKA